MKRERVLGLVLLQAATVVPLVAAGLGARTVGIAIAWVAVALQLGLGNRTRAMLGLLASAMVLGTLAESALAMAGVLQFRATDAIGIPAWLPPSWALLGASFTHVLAPLRGRVLLAWLVGALGSALALQGAIVAGEIAMAPIAWRFAVVAATLGTIIALVAVLAARWTEPTRPR